MSKVKIVTPKRKNPLGVATSKGAFHLVGLTVIVVPVKPLANKAGHDVRRQICRDRYQECQKIGHNVTPLSHKDSGDRPQTHYIINFDKKIQEAMPRAGLFCKGKALS